MSAINKQAVLQLTFAMTQKVMAEQIQNWNWYGDGEMVTTWHIQLLIVWQLLRCIKFC